MVKLYTTKPSTISALAMSTLATPGEHTKEGTLLPWSAKSSAPTRHNQPRRSALSYWIQTISCIHKAKQPTRYHLQKRRVFNFNNNQKGFIRTKSQRRRLNGTANIKSLTKDMRTEHVAIQHALSECIEPQLGSVSTGSFCSATCNNDRSRDSRLKKLDDKTQKDNRIEVPPSDTSAKCCVRTSSGYPTYVVPGQFYYRDVLYNSPIGHDTLKVMKDMTMNPDDVFIAGFPKSGTTWLQEIVYLVRSGGDFDYCRKVPTWYRVPFLEGSGGQYKQLQIPNRAGCIIKTHAHTDIRPTGLLRYDKGPAPKVIYVIRNPKDVAVSYYHFYRSFHDLGLYTGTWDQFSHMFLQGQVVVGDWLQHVSGWWREGQDATNLLFLHYEKMMADPRGAVQAIARHLERDLSSELIDQITDYTSFTNMKRNPMTNYNALGAVINSDISPFMRKGIVGDWISHFTPAQNGRYAEKYDSVLKELGLHIQYTMETK